MSNVALGDCFLRNAPPELLVELEHRWAVYCHFDVESVCAAPPVAERRGERELVG